MLLTVLLFLSIPKLFATEKTTKISGDLPFLTNGDTVEITLNKYPDLPEGINHAERFNISVLNHAFDFSFKRSEPFTYVSIGFKNVNGKGLFGYIIESGGEIHISETGGDYVFTGRSAGDFEMQRKISAVTGIVHQSLPKHLTPETLNSYFTGIDLNTKNALALLETGRASMHSIIFDEMKANIIFGGSYQKYADLGAKARSALDSVKRAFLKSYTAYQLKRQIDWDTVSVTYPSKVHSSVYSNYMLARYFSDSCVFRSKPLSEHQYLEYIRNNYRGALRERLSMYVILSRLNRTKDNLEPDIDRLLAEVQNSDFHRMLLNIKQVNFGTGALTYTLTDEKDQKVNLSKYLGKIVVFDFYYTGCGNCRVLAPILHQVEENFKNRGIVFLSISIDHSKNTWLASVRSHLYSSPLSVNLYTSGNGSNDPIIKGLNVHGYPTLLLIDKKGHLVPNFKDPRTDKGQDFEKNLEAYLAK